MSLRSVPTFFLVAAGLTIALLKRKSERGGILNAPLGGKPGGLGEAIGRPRPSAARVRLGSQAWPTTPAGETRMVLGVGEGPIANFLRANGIPVGPGGKLYLPSDPISASERAAWATYWQVVNAALVPAMRRPATVPDRSFWALDPSALPNEARGPLKSLTGDDYSVGYFWTANVPDANGNARTPIRLVDIFGREYPPGDHHFGGGSWLAQLGSNLANGISYAASSIGPALSDWKAVFNVITSSPLWAEVAYAASFFPGWGTSLSVAMVLLKSYGEGVSLQDAALRALRASLPPYAQPAFDVGLAVAKGGSAANIVESEIRKHIPAKYQGAYDQGITEARKRAGI